MSDKKLNVVWARARARIIQNGHTQYLEVVLVLLSLPFYSIHCAKHLVGILLQLVHFFVRPLLQISEICATLFFSRFANRIRVWRIKIWNYR